MPNRLIKESIRTSKSIAALSDFEFRVWVYLITYVDDYGRGSADPELLKGLVFPRKKGLTEGQISKALEGLANTGIIKVYNVDGESYFCFPNWDKHQQIRAKKSRFPAPDSIGNHLISSDIKCPRNPIQSNPNPNPNPNPIEPIGSCAAPKNDAPPEAVISLPLVDKTEYSVSPEQCQEWAGLYPAVDVMQQLRSMRGWLDANPANRKTRNGIKRFVNAWLSRAQNQAGRVKPKAGGNVFLEIAREEGLT